MLQINIPGFSALKLNYALIDYNGTLAVDGKLLKGITPILNALSKHLEIHIITGDSFGTAKTELAGINCTLTILPPENQAIAKQQYLQQLNSNETVVIGNGQNDSYILKDSALGIVILSHEGAAIDSIMSANLMLPSIFQALDLLHHPHRLIATLRS
ncbi:hypothetical protein OQJ13_16110 [Legionella sp. PATHC035]|uniref:HAD family hydrolase n=1 Tax=Legionella sp. PATHC035 TaxID=2992040 RepID=UPI00224309F9|nr:hypothetical protein [Legionella sp. PATHC035]MCW8410505.1 hypothetical protein [Legionella sp. PATHC035]